MAVPSLKSALAPRLCVERLIADACDVAGVTEVVYILKLLLPLLPLPLPLPLVGAVVPGVALACEFARLLVLGSDNRL